MPVVTMRNAERYALAVGVLIMIAFLASHAILMTRTCYMGEPVAIAMALAADYVIGLSYILIWGCLVSVSKIVFSENGRLRQRGIDTKIKDFTLALWVTGAFVLLCGLTHLSTILLYAYPGLLMIVVDLAVRGATALISIGAYLVLARTRRLLLP